MANRNEQGAAASVKVSLDTAQVRADVANLCDAAAQAILAGCSGKKGTPALVRRELAASLIDAAEALTEDPGNVDEEDGPEDGVSETGEPDMEQEDRTEEHPARSWL